MTRKKLNKKYSSKGAVVYYGADIIESEAFALCANYMQHGNTTIREHTILVALVAVAIARRLPFCFDFSSLVRGALLHDLFLYDWHNKQTRGKNHAQNHASTSLSNAAKRFSLNPIEADMIKKHMFPLNITPPKYRESVILTLADKICALKETLARA